jgi:hypothetical protein
LFENIEKCPDPRKLNLISIWLDSPTSILSRDERAPSQSSILLSILVIIKGAVGVRILGLVSSYFIISNKLLILVLIENLIY